MTRQIPTGTFVEIQDQGSDSYAFAVVVPQGNRIAPNETDTFIWVRYENDCVVPVREYYTRVLTADDVLQKLNANR